MKIRVKLFTVFLVLTSQCNNVYADPTKKTISREIANCYVGHERAKTKFYKSGEAEQLKEVLAHFAGSEQVDRIILFVKQRQLEYQAHGVGVYMQPKQVVEKHCTSLDEKVADELKRHT